MDKSDLPMLLRKYPLAFALYKQYCREDSVEQLKALCQQEDDFTGQAICWLQQASSTGVSIGLSVLSLFVSFLFS